MDGFKRYGLYVVPNGALYTAGSAWLGWDSERGTAVAQPRVEGLDVSALTATPRKYGFHGTIKAPFVLAEGTTVHDLHAAAATFCATRPAVVIAKLEVTRLGGFVAITPTAPSRAMADLARAAVADLDAFRASPSVAELAKRRKGGLSAQQEVLLQRWGYAHVMEAFRFHMTLTGRTPNADRVRKALAAHFEPVLSQPFVIDTLALMGESAEGAFHLIHRYTLSG